MTDSSLRQPCANYADDKRRVKCGHEKGSHHAERVSSPDGIPRLMYYACTIAFCDCTCFIPESGIR